MIPDATTKSKIKIPQSTSQPSCQTRAELNQPMDRAALDDAQRILVKDNIGLVYVHMKHYVARHRIPWTQREWDDLVQEGCLGLIRAAQDFKPQGKIPFAAFALPRIHTAVRRAMLKRFGTGVAFAGGDSPSKRSLFGMAEKPDWSPRKPRRHSQEDDPLDALGDWWGSNKDTLGVRMREKYERAVHRAVAHVLEQGDSSDAHGELVRSLASDRHLVPDAHARKPFRQIAKRLSAPYARVTQCDRQLTLAIRRGLEGDPEFAELQRMARAQIRGVETPVDEPLERSLAKLSAAELLQRLLHSPDERRGKMMGKFFGVSAASLLQSIRNELESLPVSAREDLLYNSFPVAGDQYPIRSAECPPQSSSETQDSKLVGCTVSG